MSDRGAHDDLDHACVTARFELRPHRGQDAAAAAAELVHRLQEMSSLSDCACDLDVEVAWPGAGNGCLPAASERSR